MKKVWVAIAASSVVLLSGCASDSNVGALSKKVDQLSQELSNLKAQQTALSNKVAQNTDTANAAQEEAQRANERIDHIAQSYTK